MGNVGSMETEGGRRLPRVVIGVGGALLLGWDADRDIAVLAICCAADFVAIPWEPFTPAPGLDVVAVGYPRGGTQGQTRVDGNRGCPYNLRREGWRVLWTPAV